MLLEMCLKAYLQSRLRRLIHSLQAAWSATCIAGAGRTSLAAVGPVPRDILNNSLFKYSAQYRSSAQVLSAM